MSLVRMEAGIKCQHLLFKRTQVVTFTARGQCLCVFRAPKIQLVIISKIKIGSSSVNQKLTFRFDDIHNSFHPPDSFPVLIWDWRHHTHSLFCGGDPIFRLPTAFFSETMNGEDLQLFY